MKEGVQHPVAAGAREALAVLRLAGSSRLAPVGLDTGDSLMASCSGGGRPPSVNVALASEEGWTPFEFSKAGACGEPAEQYSWGSKLLCGTAGEDLADAPLPGTPLIAGPRTAEGATLVGLVTTRVTTRDSVTGRVTDTETDSESNSTLVLSRVSAQAQWVLGVMHSSSSSVFPARKLVLGVVSFNPPENTQGPWTARVYQGASFSAPPAIVDLSEGYVTCKLPQIYW